MTIKEQFITEARTWIGTPYMRDAGVKRGGTNCSRFVLAVIEQVLKVDGSFLRAKPHPRLFQDSPEAVTRFLSSFCVLVEKEDLQTGDIVVVTLRGIPCQTAIYTGGENFIFVTRFSHVIEAPLPPNLWKRVSHVFRARVFEEE